MSDRKIVLSIAGSDSGGGAGIQADIKTISALGAFATTAITAITAQNTQGVRAVYHLKAEQLKEQLEAVGDDMDIASVKIGMLPCAEQIEVVVEAIGKYKWQNVVLDPVMVATSGDILVKNSVVNAMVNSLFPLCRIITPNLAEASALCGKKIVSKDDMRSAAREICLKGVKAVLVKGGHLQDREMIDILCVRNGEKEDFYEYSSNKIDTKNLHGTGCTLSSAIATYLSDQNNLEEAVDKAKQYIYRAIKGGSSEHIGKGNGPVNHFVDYADICK